MRDCLRIVLLANLLIKSHGTQHHDVGYDESATAHIALILQNYVDHTYAGTQNSSGDDQLHLDIACDDAVFRSIRDALVFAVAASEETPEETDVSPTALKEDDPMYSVGFDPLDGSSIIDANFSGINVIFLLLLCSPSSPPRSINCFHYFCSRVTLFFASPFFRISCHKFTF